MAQPNIQEIIAQEASLIQQGIIYTGPAVGDPNSTPASPDSVQPAADPNAAAQTPATSPAEEATPAPVDPPQEETPAPVDTPTEATEPEDNE